MYLHMLDESTVSRNDRSRHALSAQAMSLTTASLSRTLPGPSIKRMAPLNLVKHCNGGARLLDLYCVANVLVYLPMRQGAKRDDGVYIANHSAGGPRTFWAPASILLVPAEIFFENRGAEESINSYAVPPINPTGLVAIASRLLRQGYPCFEDSATGFGDT